MKQFKAFSNGEEIVVDAIELSNNPRQYVGGSVNSGGVVGVCGFNLHEQYIHFIDSYNDATQVSLINFCPSNFFYEKNVQYRGDGIYRNGSMLAYIPFPSKWVMAYYGNEVFVISKQINNPSYFIFTEIDIIDQVRPTYDEYTPPPVISDYDNLKIAILHDSYDFE